MLHSHTTAQVGAVKSGVVELLERLLLVLDYEDRFVFQHLVCKLQTLDALQLRVDGLSFHTRVVSKNALVHILLSQLKAVLVRNLPGNDASGGLGVAEVVHAKEFQNLQLLPNSFLLGQQILLQQFNFGWSLITCLLMLVLHLLLLVLSDEGDRVGDVVRLAHALARVLNLADHHVYSLLIGLLGIVAGPPYITFQFLMQIIHSL